MFEVKPSQTFCFKNRSRSKFQFSKYAPAEVVIYRSLLPTRPLFLHKILESPTGDLHDLCYMGQILYALGYPTLVDKQPTRLVSDIKPSVPGFTYSCRERTVPTPESCRIMSLRPGPQAETTLPSLLPEGLSVRFEESHK